MHFHGFLEAVSFSHGSILNLSNIARDCAVERKTVEGYVHILEDLLLAFRVPVFKKRAKRHLISHPKFYLFDTGVFRTLRPSGPLDDTDGVEGVALEGLIAQHLHAWIDYSSFNAKLYFWQTKSGVEVDFVVYGQDVFYAIEVKRTVRVNNRDLHGLKRFAEDYPQCIPILLYLGKEKLFKDGIMCMPCNDFLRKLVPDQILPI